MSSDLYSSVGFAVAAIMLYSAGVLGAITSKPFWFLNISSATILFGLSATHFGTYWRRRRNQ